ncbi:hypothetical protein [Streptoalloteichus tenebrarius]|uniref:hypothetical protein n=1 Tax=Streptoalloteichus tenebrarius (strain ATCC 17920 / DSM 40477 / JCM 4838 / CBS 697.72 / NBRC 16177 / NCIMB 11028 / NRRL B-12390 / A12253. 1 / ISP 5477) TaxID=1933 RepID=UPI0020A345AD|nr:hypothetical protein [Streptoalloteichus tenebrarius]
MATLLSIPLIILEDAVFEQESQSQTAASRVGTEFVWPDHFGAADPEAALRILTEAAEATKANVLRTSVNTSRSGRKHITHYLLMSRDGSGLFHEFALADGRWLSRADSHAGTVTVSSARTGEPSNAGVPVVFGSNYDLTFAPLRQAFDSLPVAGRYFVESDDNATAGHFLTLVHQRLVESGVHNLTIKDFKAEHPQNTARGNTHLKSIAYILTGVATLIIAFILLREGKRIGVLRLLGHSSARIWYRVVGRLQLAAVLLGLAACAAVSLIVPGGGTLFLNTLVLALGEVTAAGFAATMIVGLTIIHRVQVAELIKGRLR